MKPHYPFGVACTFISVDVGARPIPQQEMLNCKCVSDKQKRKSLLLKIEQLQERIKNEGHIALPDGWIVNHA